MCFVSVCVGTWAYENTHQQICMVCDCGIIDVTLCILIWLSLCLCGCASMHLCLGHGCELWSVSSLVSML